MRVLCLHLPDFAAQRIQRTLAEASADAPRPVVLTQRRGSTMQVVGACARARELGLSPGITLAQARAAVPEIVAQEFALEQDLQALQDVARWATRFSPLVEAAPPDSILLDIEGCAHLLGGEQNLARQAIGGLARLGYAARAAIADSVGAAYACAAASGNVVTLVPEGLNSAYLAPLPTASLRIPRSIDETLYLLGVRSIGDLMMLPRSSLASRFGPLVGQRLQQALGEIHEGIALHRAPPPLFARCPFDDGAVHELATLQAVAERLLLRVFEQTRQRSLAVRRLECVLYALQGEPRVIAVEFSAALREPTRAFALLREKLDKIDLTVGFRGVVLQIVETARWSPGQSDLFEPHDPKQLEALGDLLDRLRNRLGEADVSQVELVADYQPECAFRYTPARIAEDRHTPHARLSNAANLAQVQPTALPRPVRLRSRPLPIRATATGPDGPPAQFEYRGETQMVADCVGPERIETGWWRGPDVRRDYYRVIAESGGQYWLFRERGSGKWFLQGEFA